MPAVRWRFAALSTNLALLALFCLAGATGCRRSPGQGGGDQADESPITGRPSDPPATLQPEWKPDHRYLMRLETLQTLQWPVSGQSVTQETYFEQEYALTVTNASEGQRGIELEIRALSVDAYWGDNHVLYFDSLNPATPSLGPGTELLARAIGGRIGFVLGPDNRVNRVDGIPELFERVTQPVTGQPGEGQFGRFSGILQRLYNADYFKQMVDVSVLPPRAVRVGDTWIVDKVIEVGMVGRVVVTSTNRLRGWQERQGRNCARIEFDGALGLKSGKAEGLLAMIDLNLEGGQVTGTAWFDPAIGLPIESRLEQSCTLTGRLPNWGRLRAATGAPRARDAASDRFRSPWKQTTKVKIEDARSTDG